uniref:IFT52 GIFT domain-containing protein n=1 Tax=Ciona savignyi TaxID=51511 RepID=H2YKM7_CIOSA
MMPPAPQMGMEELSSRNTVLFTQCKRELFTINSGYKSWHRRLRNSWKVGQLKEEISIECLGEAKLLIIAAPRERFTSLEFESLKRYRITTCSPILRSLPT